MRRRRRVPGGPSPCATAISPREPSSMRKSPHVPQPSQFPRLLRRGGARVVEPSRLRPRDLVSESLAGVLQRPARTVLTLLGTVLGVGAFTAILGLTSTIAGQIS